ncbi:MAG: potassium transporter TrkG [Lachnospiraceae bacterium]|nr:potassium transporter TrkG [Lachnospiraceae bacterium]
MQEEKKKSLRFTTMQKLALGFFGVIFIGGVMLWLPISNVDGQIAFIDALFTATSAVCVTGLMTIVAAAQFTIFGKVILLLLIQIGGLGVIACTTAFFIIIGKKITVRDRVVIQETYNLDTLSGMVSLIIRILKCTLFFEGVGAVFFAFQFIPEFGIIRGGVYAIFHAISAFCNAGIDIIGTTSFTQYVKNPIVSITTMALIVSGGLGFTVWFDLMRVAKEKKKHQWTLSTTIERLMLHSKLVITVTLILIFGGTAVFMLLEWNNSKTISSFNVFQKFMACAFQSVTTRTAGFATLPQTSLKDESIFVSCILMFIGGSPAGTAGGVKTTTVAMLILTCITVIKGGKDTECFGRRIPGTNIRSGISIIIVSFTAMVIGTIAMTAIENADFLSVLFETNSALGTVGLSRDLTPTLSSASKLIDMALMYIGRIGPITMALAFGYKKDPTTLLKELPTKRIMVG